jgi:hypothetical protein
MNDPGANSEQKYRERQDDAHDQDIVERRRPAPGFRAWPGLEAAIFTG